jgi:hypothetical protein
MRMRRLKQPGPGSILMSRRSGASASSHGCAWAGHMRRSRAKRASASSASARSSPMPSSGTESTANGTMRCLSAAQGGARRDASCDRWQALEKAQNGNWQLLEKVGMDLGLAHSRLGLAPLPLGFGATPAWDSRRARLGSPAAAARKDRSLSSARRRATGGGRGPQNRPNDPASTSAGAPKDMNSDWRRGLDCAGLDIPAEPRSRSRPQPPERSSSHASNAMRQRFLREEISYCRTGRERLCFVRDLFRQDRDS